MDKFNYKKSLGQNFLKDDNICNKIVDSALIDNSENLDFDFNELLNTLKNSVQSENITTFISECKEKTISEGEPPETEIKNIEVSNNTIDTIIKKLKLAKSIDKDITYSWPYCPPKLVTYYVSVNSSDAQLVHKQKVFSLNYAQGNDMLLVGYNNKGYAFHFSSNEEINGFIESLK